MQNQRLKRFLLWPFSSLALAGLGCASQAATLFRSLRCSYSRRGAAYWLAVLSCGFLVFLASILFCSFPEQIVSHPLKYMTRFYDRTFLLPFAGILLLCGWKKSFVIFVIMIVCFRFQLIGVIFAYLIIESVRNGNHN